MPAEFYLNRWEALRVWLLIRWYSFVLAKKQMLSWGDRGQDRHLLELSSLVFADYKSREGLPIVP